MPNADRSVIITSDAPQAIGPYSQAIRAGTLIFASGQVALDPASGTLVGEDVAAQTRRALDNVRAVLRAAGADLGNVVKTTVFLTDMSDFTSMNEIYATYFSSQPPARSTVAVAQLPRGARVEIECIAVL